MPLFNWGQNNGNAPTPGGARPIGQQPTSNPGMSTFGFPTAPPRTAMPGGAQPTGPMPGIPVSPASNGPGGILTAFGRGLFAGGNGIAPPAQQPLPARTPGVSGAQPVGGGGGITQPIGAPTATPGRNVAAPILGGPRVTPISAPTSPGAGSPFNQLPAGFGVVPAGPPTNTIGSGGSFLNGFGGGAPRSIANQPSGAPQPVGQVPRQSGAAPVGGGGVTQAPAPPGGWQPGVVGWSPGGLNGPIVFNPSNPTQSAINQFQQQVQQWRQQNPNGSLGNTPVFGQGAQVANPLGWGARPQPMQAPAGASSTLGAGAPRGNRNRQPGQ